MLHQLFPKRPHKNLTSDHWSVFHFATVNLKMSSEKAITILDHVYMCVRLSARYSFKLHLWMKNYIHR